MMGGGIHVRMRSRDTAEPHRASSPLELLYDLVFVVAVGSLVTEAVTTIVDGRAAEAVVPFLFVFFAIWWAWINFTWFASAYDTDDVIYRLLAVVQMGGVLVLAAGVPQAFDDINFDAVTIGYVIMRIGQLGLWVRAAIEQPETRRTSLRYGGGVLVVQIGWILRLLLPEPWMIVAASLVLGVLEVLTPLWAERTGGLAWHPHHIAERYGLFVIILLGESVLAAVGGVQVGLAAGGVTVALVAVSIASLVVLVALWWAYFLQPAGLGLARRRSRSFVWGYGHYFLFVALAAVGGGLEVAVEAASGEGHVDARIVVLAVAAPAALAAFLIWGLHAPLLERSGYPAVVAIPAAVVILATPLTEPVLGVAGSVIAIALVLAASVAASMALWQRRAPRAGVAAVEHN